ncbi:MAG: ArnT family glycosyltransferase [Candidatus Aminicenantes bacterium]
MRDSQVKKFSQRDWLLAAGLFVVGLAARIPFASKLLFHSDSVRFALAMEHFDVARMRPHAPGYILYVAAAKLAHLLIHDARVSLVGVSVLSSALTIPVLYFLAAKMFGRSTALISSLLLLSSPLYWYNSEMPFTYALESLFALLFVYSCCGLVMGGRRWLIVSAVLLGLAAGVRPNIIILFLPLWLFALRKYSFKHILSSFFVFGLTCLAWFAPLVIMTGGLGKYLTVLNAQYKMVVLYPASYLFQVKVRTTIFLKFMLYGLTLGLLPMIYYFGRFFRISSVVKDIRLRFLLIWIVPAVLFYTGVNIWNPGQVMVILPPLMIFMAESVKGLAKDKQEGLSKIMGGRPSSLFKVIKSIFSYKALLPVGVCILLLVNIFIFLFGHTQVSYPAIKKEETRLTELIRLTEENTSPEKTMILALFQNTQAGYYLPDYLICCPFPIIFSDAEIPVEAQNVYISHQHQTNPKTYWIPSGFKIQPIPVPEGVDTLMVWEKDIARYYQNEGRSLREIESGRMDVGVYSLKVEPGEKIHYGYHFWTVKERDPSQL